MKYLFLQDNHRISSQADGDQRLHGESLPHWLVGFYDHYARSRGASQRNSVRHMRGFAHCGSDHRQQFPELSEQLRAGSSFARVRADEHGRNGAHSGATQIQNLSHENRTLAIFLDHEWVIFGGDRLHRNQI